jgi:hypothetical protein
LITLTRRITPSVKIIAGRGNQEFNMAARIFGKPTTFAQRFAWEKTQLAFPPEIIYNQ